jgi:hypothetical protein
VAVVAVELGVAVAVAVVAFIMELFHFSLEVTP